VGYVRPESTDERARHRVADSIYLLRQSLGDDVVGTSGEVLRLNPNVVWTDAVAFRQHLERGDLEAAVQLYDGPFLDGFFAEGTPEFEHWVETERRDLADRYATALETLAAGAEETGDISQAVVWWRRLAAHDRYNSRVVLRLMQALVAAGDPANAIQQAQEHAAYLKKELELDLPSELMGFVEQQRKEVAGGEPASDAVPSATGADAARLPQSPVVEPSPGTSVGRLLRKHRIAAAGLAASAVLVTALLVRQFVTTGPSQAERRSIAVLPFENLTGDPMNDYLAAGFHEELISQLTKIGDVRVIARSSVMEYRDNPKSPRTVAQELGVDHILEASLRAEGERLRITAQLIDPETSGHLWAENYDRVRGNLLDVQLDIALSIAESLRAHLEPQELARIEARPTESQDAYDFYLRGVYFHDRLDRPTAIQMYERAIELDSSFALAYARIRSPRSAFGAVQLPLRTARSPRCHGGAGPGPCARA
jgi:TolB-like protein/DNA-binding SARP family transcriptional activator